MGIRNFDAISIGNNTSTQTANIAAAGSVAIPVTASGLRPKYLHIKAYGGVTVADYISVTPKTSAVSGVFATGFVLSAFYADEIILNVHGHTHIGFDFVGAATSDLQLTPLEDF